MSVGRNVRATPMRYAQKQKELEWGVRHLSWVPPWVRRRSSQGGELESHEFLGANTEVEDSIGLGRIPSHWWTLNRPYNHAFDIHRLNIDAKRGREALEGDDRELRQVRYDFIRDAPDLACSQMTVRAELNMKMVMPTVVPPGAGEAALDDVSARVWEEW